MVEKQYICNIFFTHDFTNLINHTLMEYFIAVNGQQQGPFSIEALRAQNISPATLVWAPGMATWQQAIQVAELQPLFMAQPSAEMIAKPVGEVARSLDDGQAYRKWMPTMYMVVGILCCLLPLVYIIKVVNLDYFKDGMKTVVAILNILIFVLPPGAFISLGFLIAIVNKIRKV